MTLRLGFPQAAAAALALAALSACSTNSPTTTAAVESGLRVDPPTPQVAPGAQVRFAVVGAEAPVTVTQWTVLEENGGTVDADGTYRAPATEGTYHVVPQVDGVPAGTIAPAEVLVQRTVETGPPDDTWVDVTAFGAVGDGQADDTAAFASAAATGKNLWIPKPSAHYRVSSKVRVYGSVRGVDQPEIRMYGADGTEARTIFELRDYVGPGASFTGLHLNGQWDGYSQDGEWSHLILVKGSQNVTISGNVLERPYGDDILLGGEGDLAPSVNVVIEDNVLDGARRCAVAVLHARDVVIQQNTITRQSAYVAAIDVEPNPNNVDHVERITIRGNTFHSAGIAVQLYTFGYSSLPSWDIDVTGNTSDQGTFFVKPLGTSAWSSVRVTGNTITGGSFVRVWDMSDLTIDGNRATTSDGFDHVSGVSGLVMTNNAWSGPSSYPVTITQSPGAQLSGNTFQGVNANVSP